MCVNEYSNLGVCIWLINKVPPIYVKLLLAVDDDFASTTLNWSESGEARRETMTLSEGRDCLRVAILAIIT